jgi:hypothetical protein
MDMLTYDILLNVAKRNNRARRRQQTSVLLPTKIIEITPVICPKSATARDLCQKVFAQISLVDAEDTWKVFKATTELAIEVGSLQFHLDEIDPDCPADILDARWQVPSPGSVLPPSFLASVAPAAAPSETVQTESPTVSPTALDLYDLLVRTSFDKGVALNDTSSPQSRAYSWLQEDPGLTDYSSQRILQRYSLATLYYATNGDEWQRNDLWLSNQTECEWYSKAGSRSPCNENQEMVNLELDQNNLGGSLPPELGLLSSSLERITFRGGPSIFLSGTIPSELGYLTLMKSFFLRGNDFVGSIPTEIGNWSALKQLDLSRNLLKGHLPTQIGNFRELVFLEISANSLSGELPTEIGLLRECTKIYFEDNVFLSSIPTELGHLSLLQVLKGGANVFMALPSELGRLTSADIISFQGSSITSSIPTEFGQLRGLRKFTSMEKKDNRADV